MPDALPLRPLQAPAELSWPGPTAVEWLLSFAVGLGLLICLLWFARRVRRHRWRRSLQKELDRLASLVNATPEQATREAMVLIRRLLLLHHPREQIAAITGDAWLAHLEALCADTWFSAGNGRELVHAGFARPGDPRTAALALEAADRLVRATLVRLPDPPRA
ncbi:MAG TPA: hypothetical protein DCY89_05125 [Gammaproteobacteria bacterium]|nr:hypothetical protein [Gammaproteobacteria bacterium]